MTDLIKDERSNDISKTRMLLQQMTQLIQFNFENGNKAHLPQLLEKILNLAMEFIDAESGCLFTFDQNNILQSLTCVTPLTNHQRQSLLEVGKIAAQRVIQSNTPVYISDIRVWMGKQNISIEALPYKAILIVPMFWKGQLMGVFQFWDNQGINYFKEDIAEWISLIANQTAALLHNVTILETEHQQRIIAEKLASAATTLTSSLDINYILESILRLLADVVPYDSASILLAEQDTLTLVAHRGLTINGSKKQMRFPIDDPLFAEIKQARAPIILEDASKDSRFHGWLNTQNVRGWMGVPLISRDEVIGYITLDSYKSNAYQKIHGQWASAFANQAAVVIENARLFQENEKRANDLEALRQVSLSLITNIELEKVLDAILQSVFTLLPNVRNAHIFLYHPQEEDQFRFGAALWSDGQRGKPVAPPRKNGLTAMVAQTGKLIAVEDMRQHPLYHDMPSNWNGSIIGIPLKIGTWVVGVMNVSFSEPRIFPENELRLLGFLADQAAIAIQNARLYHQVQNEKRNLSVLYAISHELTSSLESNEILDRAVSLVTKALGGHFGLAMRYQPQDKTLVISACSGEKQLTPLDYAEKFQWRLGQGIVGWVAQHRQGAFLSDVSADSRWIFIPGIDEGTQSAICAPILFEENLYGVMTVLHPNKNAFNAEDLKFIQAICQEVGLALSNAERYQEAQYRLRQMLLLQTFTRSFIQRLDLQELLKTMVDELVQNFSYPTVEIYLLHQDSLVLRASHGGDPRITRLPLDRGLIGKAIREKQPVLSLDVTQDPEYQPDIPGTVAELVVPILHQDAVVGVINIETNQVGKLTQNDFDFLRLLADQIAIALENARLYEDIRNHASELEKAVSERTVELSELFELSQEIGYTLSYEELTQILLRHLRNAVKCDFTVGCLLNNGKTTLFVDAARPFSPTLIAHLKKHCQNELYQQLSQEINFTSFQINLAESQSKGEPITQFQSIPHTSIFLGEKLIGMLGMGDEDQIEFSEEQNRLLQTFANQAGIAMQRLEVVRNAENKRLGDIIEDLPSGIFLLDTDYHILALNPLASQILDDLHAVVEGGILRKLGGFQIHDLLSQYNSPSPKDLIIEGIPRRIFETQARPVGETPANWVLIIREVTRERETQMRVQMQERLATVGQLAAGIAHDFNNIMAAILVYADLLRNDAALSQASQDRLAIIQQQVQRAASLIRQILDFSRRSIMEQSTLDLLPFIKEFEKMLRRVMPETISIELFYKPTQYLVNADPTRMQQVLMNLALNSRDAMPNGGVITLSLDRLSLKPDDPRPSEYIQPGEWVCISLKDNGEGIAPENLPHIFEPFFTTKPIGLGTGLGLAQVYGIVKQHGGYIDVESKLGYGTTFTIYLPVLAEPEQEANDEQPTELVDGAGKVVLVVEDDEATRAALKTLLEVQQYTVLTASDGKNALDILEHTTQKIDLVISDIVMPKMGGLELFQIIQNKNPSIQMLMITGHPMKEENRVILEKGNVHWLQKPFSIQDFNQAILELTQ